MKALTIIGLFLSGSMGFMIILAIYACNFVTHSCFDLTLNIPVMIFFVGLACIAFGMMEDDLVIEQ
jgi:uncharacterized membrane protein YesL